MRIEAAVQRQAQERISQEMAAGIAVISRCPLIDPLAPGRIPVIQQTFNILIDRSLALRIVKALGARLTV
jgi:hypothetical protein